ncbi:oligosaccharide flippase family protein [Vibrio vulnificus]|uniref:oligosaccharide flippase family protein n=1 Tax=Vibrio vulnificus TaxID=672 RepID=UPI00072163D2|nr:oligosaccharide flippase family protein [Vibrio vulnificus]ALM72127.1 hypothetical protein FORC9_2610 [Vibrio vulnificus]ANH62070.1 hypothetical protein FORC16_0187 [Vibrio vulnificus]
MLSNILKVLTGNVFSSIATYLSLLYLSFNISMAYYGDFTKFYYAIGILFVIFDLGLSSSLIIKYSKINKTFSIKGVINRFKYQYILCFIITSSISLVFFSYQTTGIILAIAMFGIVNRFTSVKFQISQLWSDSAKVIFSLTLIRASSLVIFVLLSRYFFNESVSSNDLEFVVLVATFISIAINIIHSNKKLRDVEVESVNKIDLKSTSQYIYIGSILAVICMRVDVFLIDYFINSESAGEYARVSIIFFMFPMLISSINSVLLRYYSSSDSNITEPLNGKLKYIISGCILFYSLFVFFVSQIHGLLITYVTHEMIVVFLVLSLAYLGSLISGTYESKIMANNQKYFMSIKFVQLISLFFVFSVTYNMYGIVSGSLAFLASRISGWLLIINFYVSENENFNNWLFWKK